MNGAGAAVILAAAGVAVMIAAQSAVRDGDVVARSSRNIELREGRVDIPLQPVDSAALTRRLAGLGPDDRVILSLNDLSADEAPGTQFAIYFNAPPDQQPRAGEELGRLAFFNEVRAGRTDAPTSSRTFDVTALMRGALRPNSAPPMSVSVVAQRRPADGAKATIGQVELRIR
jgi:hypothetical protein